MSHFLKAAQLIDGTGSAPLPDPLVQIGGGRILSVGQGPAPSGAKVQEFPGGTILPGLIETHSHLNLPGNGLTLEEAMREGVEVMLATTMGNAATALRAGITTIRDLGAFGTTSISARRAIELGYAEGARIMACGQPITITGGHTWYMGGEADGEDGLRLKVRQMIKDGADFIKVMGSGGGTLGTMAWRPAYSLPEMQAIVGESHRNGRMVTVHCLCAEAIDIAITAGVDQIEHAGFLTGPGTQSYDPAVADRLAASGIPVTSTLAVCGTILNALRALESPRPDQVAFLDRWVKTLAMNMDHGRKLREAGVRFVAGTDAGWRYTSFDSLVQEMELLEQIGMSRGEAIHAATGFAAEAIHLHGRGTIAEGMAADVIVTPGDPLADLDALRDLDLILKDGRSIAPAGRAAMNPVAASCPA
ncbi:amidohydrolase family protein [Mangrovicoccus sp. HB161399]|uniref:metal-dependent hydrolase family protein n=1 Tax=Mangrovicoccus sp. HB161399 TaxID=2720392 RepID=UPI0015516A79|nr:amidohydrolase family protein [Mangrovicoccus sp. HB161399]